MKQKKWLMLPLVCLLLVGCYYCPGVWSDAPQSFTFTLDKYEVKAGDEITVDTGDVRIFDSEKFFLICIDRESDAYESCTFEFVKKISSSKAIFKVPNNVIPGRLEIEGDIVQKRGECDDEVWYAHGKANEKLIIIQ